MCLQWRMDPCSRVPICQLARKHFLSESVCMYVSKHEYIYIYVCVHGLWRIFPSPHISWREIILYQYLRMCVVSYAHTHTHTHMYALKTCKPCNANAKIIYKCIYIHIYIYTYIHILIYIHKIINTHAHCSSKHSETFL